MQESKVFVVVTLLVSGWLVGCEGEGSSQEENLCEGVDCSGHGTCRVENDEAVCDCEQGYHAEGLACVGGADVCEGVDCSGHGTCRVENDEAVCDCEQGYHAEGLACVEGADVCEGVDCSGHGTCRVENDEAVCDCEQGYHAEGLTCLEGPSPCEGVDCSGHGTCRVENGEAVCDCEDGYVAYKTICNQYLQPVDIPEYDPNDASLCLIPDDYPWSSETLNNEACQHFYVRPGDYLDAGRVVITVSGTEDERRTISLYNGNDLHPGQMEEDEMANVVLRLTGASYWVIDRMSTMHNSYTSRQHGAGSFALDRGSSHNIFNRIYTTDVDYFMQIRHEAHDNTIQNSYFNGVSDVGLNLDISFITLMDWVSGPMEIFDTKIINNEFRNFKALKLHDEEGNNDPRYNGTIVDSNVFWFDGRVYCDEDGTRNPNGVWARVECDPVGIKEGSLDPEHPVIISNNVYWGGKPTYPNPDDHLSDPAPGFSTCYLGSSDVHFLNNLVIGTPNGITIADRYDEERGTWRVEIAHNIFYQCGKTAQTAVRFSSPLRCSQAEEMNVHHNLIKQPRGDWAKVQYNFYNNYFGENDVVEMDEPMVYQDNREPVEGIRPTDTNHYYSLEEGNAIYTKDYVVRYFKFTNHPETMVIPNVLKP